MSLKKILRRVLQPSSLAGLAGVAVAIPQIVGAGASAGEAVAGGLTATGQAVAAGVPWYIAIALGVAAVARDDKSDASQ